MLCLYSVLCENMDDVVKVVVFVSLEKGLKKFIVQVEVFKNVLFIEGVDELQYQVIVQVVQMYIEVVQCVFVVLCVGDVVVYVLINYKDVIDIGVVWFVQIENFQ